MAIYVNLNIVMAHRRISSQELAEQVGITQANLSILKTVEGGLCNGQRPFQSQPCRGETVLLQVRRCDVQRHAGASDWLDRHNGPPFAKINPTVDGIIPDGRGLWIAVMIGGIGKGAESMI